MSTISIHRAPSIHPARSIRRAPSRPRATSRPVRAVPAVRPTQPPRAASVAPASRPAVRLTRRGRFVVFVLVSLVVSTAFTALGARSAATGERGSTVQTRTVEVGPGDTLWGIASEVAAPGDVRETVLRIKQLNALPGPGLVVGQEIAVPVG
jgi:hypothetical protein